MRATTLQQKSVRWGIRLLYVAGILVLVYALRVSLLSGIARLWVVQDSIEKSDAVLVLGGGTQSRPFEAARLYHRGYARKVLVINIPPDPTDKIGVTSPYTKRMIAVLLRQGVPAEVITTIGNHVSNTRDEALALRGWLVESGAQSVIVPTDAFHTRRVRWFFGKTLRGTGAQVRVQALDVGYDVDNWWQSEEGVVGFQNEVLKYVYYWLKY